MSTRLRTGLAASMLAALSVAGAPGEPPGPAGAGLREGSWTHRGSRNILGAGTDTTITLRLLRVGDHALEHERAQAVWTVTYTRVHHPTVDQRRAPTVETSGPFRAEVNEGEGTVRIEDGEGGRPRSYTFAFSEDAGVLTMPAFVETRPGRFVFIGERGSFLVECEHDPRRIPVGRCTLPGVESGRAFYSYEEAPRSRDDSDDKSSRRLRLFERVEEGGYLIERGRLVWDSWGSPRYERILSTGESERHHHRIRIWHARHAEDAQ